MKNFKTSNPAVSIALCTYNGERFLREQLDSILNQEYENIAEIVCVDDRSTDSTWSILNEYANKYSVFKAVKNDINLGFIKNYEKAITLCNNNLIAISDQDDIWYASKISKLVNSIGDGLMIYSDNEYIDEDGNLLGVKFSDKRNLTTTSSCLNFTLFNGISGHTVLFKREMLVYALPFPADIHYDWWLAFCASQHSVIQYIPEPLVGYRQHISNAVGGYGVKKSDKKVKTYNILNETRIRISFFAEHINPKLVNEKRILEFLTLSYTRKSLIMRIKRVILFWQNREDFLLFKKRSKIRKMIYCLKAFWKYD
ncbi:MAG: glycosyltransferase family 2 protein [Paludibacter sp.]